MSTAKQLGAFRGALVFVVALALTVLTTSTPGHAQSVPDPVPDPAPNLEVGTPTFDNYTPYTGRPFTMSVTVTNAGDARSEATTLRYKQSDGTEVGTDAVGALEPGEESEQSITLIAPARRDNQGHGSYFTYKACVDTVTDESDTTDNCTDFVEEVLIKVAVRLPADLSMTSANRVGTVIPIPFGPGVTFHLRSTVDNVGQTASVATTVRYYQSADTTITTSDTEVGTSAIGAIAPASLSAQGINLTAPSTAGTYYYGACVDAVTGESDTTNNCTRAATLIVPAPAPNLVAWLESVNDASPAPGGPITLSASVANWGTEDAEATTLRYYYTTRSPLMTLSPSSDTQVGTVAISALASGVTSGQSTNLTAPSTVGTYYYYACVDTVTDESVTTDNCQYFGEALQVTVTNTPATGAPTISGTAQVGQTLTASTTGISDADGLTNVSYSYQWLADDTEINGATNSTYAVQSGDNGKVIKVRVSFTDDGGSNESLTSAGTSAVVMGGL